MNRKSLLVIYIQLFLLLAISINTFKVSMVYKETIHDVMAENEQLEQPPKSITIINGIHGPMIPTFHPMYDSHSLLSLPFDTLVEIDPITNDVIPSLAKQWVVTNDSRQWTFYIRENVTCHDGSKFNASAVAAAFDMILDPSKVKGYNPEEPFEAIHAYYTMPLESIHIIDEYMIRITFSIPYSSFIRIQASRIRIPSLTSYPAINIEDFNLPIGSGPYMLQKITNEANYNNYTFTKFSNYFRGEPPFETIHYLLYWNLEDANEAVLNQKGEVGPLYSGEIVNNSDINLDYWRISKYQQFANGLDIGFINHQRTAALTNRDVRLALNYAINKQEYIERTTLGYPLDSYIPKSLIVDKSLWNDSILSIPFDPELANTLLDKAGYPRKSELEGYRFTLTVDGIPIMKDEIIEIMKSLDKIGVKCVSTIPDNTGDIDWFNEFYRGDYDIFFLGFAFTNDWSYNAYALLNSKGAQNIGTHVFDPILETFTSLAIQTPVKQEKHFYLSRVVNRLVEYVPHILLAEMECGYLKTASVESHIWVDPIPQGGIYFNFDNNQRTIPKIIENVEITNQSIYFPFTDGIITTKKKFTVTSEMSYNLHTFNQKEKGKYFKTTVDDQKTEYFFRCYYDPYEIVTPVDEGIPVFLWDDQSQEWKEIKSVVRNSSLNYVEIKVEGDILVRVGEGIIELTFKYFPGVTIALGVFVTIAAVTIYYNYRQTNYLRREYELK
ncbi:MAG: ABC transporter substrate-binding protein [Promethearchaeota archaeon]